MVMVRKVAGRKHDKLGSMVPSHLGIENRGHLSSVVIQTIDPAFNHCNDAMKAAEAEEQKILALQLEKERKLKAFQASVKKRVAVKNPPKVTSPISKDSSSEEESDAVQEESTVPPDTLHQCRRQVHGFTSIARSHLISRKSTTDSLTQDFNELSSVSGPRVPHVVFCTDLDENSNPTAPRELPNNVEDAKKVNSHGRDEKVDGSFSAVSHRSAVRKAFMEEERERVRDRIRLREMKRHVARVKKQSEEERKILESASNGGVPHGSQALVPRISIDNHSPVNSPRNSDGNSERETEAMDSVRSTATYSVPEPTMVDRRAIEARRYQNALHQSIRDITHSRNISLPPLCSCTADFWTTDPDNCCVNNCMFYKNRKAYDRAVKQLLHSYDIHLTW